MFPRVLYPKHNDAPDISETLRKQVLETAVALGYAKLRRYKKPVKKSVL